MVLYDPQDLLVLIIERCDRGSGLVGNDTIRQFLNDLHFKEPLFDLGEFLLYCGA